MKLALLACLLCSALGFTSPRLAPARATRALAPATMQFGKFLGGNKQFTSSNADERKKRSDFYDDERDTVSKPAWKPPSFGEDDMTDAERSGFTADGRDLAAAGSEIYYAVIPFLLFAFLYSNGIFSFGYDNGNF